MLLCKIEDLSKSYGDRLLFRTGRLEIHDGDRIGLVGPNGAGKSTLLGILFGDLSPDSGRISRFGPAAIVRQDGQAHSGPDGRMRHTFCVPKESHSGGEHTRRALAAAFSQHPSLLFLDEPTTNLDLDGIQTLEKQLAAFSGGFVLISHDAGLLGRLCTSIWAIQENTVRAFPGPYSAWLAQRDREYAFQQEEYERFRAEKQRLEHAAAALAQQAQTLKKAPKRMGNSEARLHKGTRTVLQGTLAHRSAALLRKAGQLAPKERPEPLPQIKMALGAAPPPTAKTALQVEGMTIRYGERIILKDICFSVPATGKTVMVGKNGSGKSSILRACMSGGPAVRFSAGVKAGYFSQSHEQLNLRQTVLENARTHSALPEHEVRTILANLGLSAADIPKPAGVLSGGERAKTALAQLLASDCNLLILDEPTNHLDLYAAQALLEMLGRWQGGLLLVTHDQTFLQALAERLLFVENQQVRTFPGGWDAWQQEQQRKSKPRDAGLSDLIEQMRRAADAAKPPAK